MLAAEAAWIEAALAAIPDDELGAVLDIGSADARFRTERQPWIEQRVFAPLAQRTRIAFCDVKAGAGVDIVADITTQDGSRRIADFGARTILCCNVLEHVPSAARFAHALGALVSAGGRLVVSVPRDYPHHADPIDTLFRPDIDELAALFPGFAIERAAIVAAGSYRDEFARRPLVLLFRHLLRLPVPFLGWRQWRRSVGKLRFLVQPYRITCACLVKRS